MTAIAVIATIREIVRETLGVDQNIDQIVVGHAVMEHIRADLQVIDTPTSGPPELFGFPFRASSYLPAKKFTLMYHGDVVATGEFA